MLTNNWMSCIGSGLFGTSTKNKDTHGSSTGNTVTKHDL